MNPRAWDVVALLASQGPDWWYESWGLGDWVRTLFNQPFEVHTFVLGALLGVVLATLAVSRHPRMAFVLTLAVVLFTFGAFEPVYLCSESYTACHHVRVKPWYFIGGFLLSYLFPVGAIHVLARRPTTTGEQWIASSYLAGGIVLTLLGFAAVSFVSPAIVHPITGLATVGSLIGTALGLVAIEWAIESARHSPSRTGAGDRAPTEAPTAIARRVLWEEREDSIVVLAYGTALGFGYPRLFWELGRLTGREGFPFGRIVQSQPGWVSVVAYVTAIFVASLLVVRFYPGVASDRRLDAPGIRALVLGHVVYGCCLFVATGFAAPLWFHLVASAPT